MTRRCSHCSNNGHNSRTCPHGVKLFGVRITDGPMRKSASTGNLMHYPGSNSNAGGSLAGVAEAEEAGYASEGFVKGSSSSSRDRKKGQGIITGEIIRGAKCGEAIDTKILEEQGIAWTEEEHKRFLFGLRKLGKGDWRGISHDYVRSRTPTQVASHAQKYFIRQSNVNKRKKRSSLFDIKPDEFGDARSLPMDSQEQEAENSDPLPIPPPMGADFESMISNSKGKELAVSLSPRPETTQYPYPMMVPAFSNSKGKEVAVSLPPRPETTQYPYPMMFPPAFSNSKGKEVGVSLPRPETTMYPCPMMVPAFYPNYYPIPLPFFMGYRADTIENKSHEVFKPTALRLKVNADQLAGMSILTLRESTDDTSSLSTAPDPLGGSERHSAFHANTRPSTGSSMNSGSSPVHAI